MKLLTSDQIHAWDAFTIQNEPISSLDLMERASAVFTDWFSMIYDTKKPVLVVCGTGNNGGDGLVIARFLYLLRFNVSVYICPISKKETDDFSKSLVHLTDTDPFILRGWISEQETFPTIPKDAVVIDAILGSGLTRSVVGYWASFFDYLNQSGAEIVSVDIPSGLFSDKHTVEERNPDKIGKGATVIKAKRVLSFEIPKLAFLLPENQVFVGDFEYKSIGLDPQFLENVVAQNVFVTADFIKSLLKKRPKFGHKGTFGHALLVVGSAGMAGAAVLAARSCMRSGVGLLTVHTPQYNRLILQISLPEAIVSVDENETEIAQLIDCQKYSAIGIGCGIGKGEKTAAVLRGYLEQASKPLVLDADALNIISGHPEWLDLIPKNSILTPHPKEFERLFGKADNDFDRLELLRSKAQSLKLHILLKGAHTIVADTEGCCFFNSTGNAGMATAGSGDVLTGIITGLLAQGYEPKNAAILGVYLHGAAGDWAAKKVGQEAMIASDIIDNLSKAFIEYS
jgi:NAD(P)H-hydrate epimerase